MNWITGSIFSNGPTSTTPYGDVRLPLDPVNAKVSELRRRGLRVAPAEGPIPGLWEVSGHPELTTGQLLAL